jgi:DNA-binding MarR family transcriptional regulator
MMKQNVFSQLVGQIIRKLNILNRDQKVCYGLTLPQCYTIETLGQKELLPMNELSRLQGVTVSTMTRVVDVLVRDEIVERVDSPGDRRKVCIRLTDKGKELAVALKTCTETYADRILENIPEEKQNQVIESLQLLGDAIVKVDNKCCT